MSIRVPYQDGVRIRRVYTDSRFPHVLITNQGGGTFNAYAWNGGMGDMPQEPDPGDPEYSFFGWIEVDVFTVDQDNKGGNDEHHAAAFAAQHFDDMEEFYCDCTGEPRAVADLDVIVKSATEVTIACPDCSRVLGTQRRRLAR